MSERHHEETPETNADDGSAEQPITSTVIVCVADDPDVVASMRRVAFHRPGELEVHIIDNGHVAAARFPSFGEVDIVIAQAVAGGESTAAFLRDVRQRSPHTVRVVLSDPDDDEATFELIGYAHRVVTLPLEGGVLTDLIEQVRTAAGNVLRDPVRTLVGQVDRLPSPPAMFQRISEIMSAEDWSLTELAHEIGQDAALTGEILKLVNSSFYSTANRITSVDRAISLVGVDLIRYIVLGNTMFRPGKDEKTWVDLDRLGARSTNVAIGARALAIRERATSDVASVAYLTGVVSEIGLLVLGRVPDMSPAVTQPVNVNAFLGAERAIFGGDRFQVGAHLLMLWGFDQPVIDAVLHLSTERVPMERDLSWYLTVARRLVVGQEFDPHDLASRHGSRHDLDDAIDELADEAAAPQDDAVD